MFKLNPALLLANVFQLTRPHPSLEVPDVTNFKPTASDGNYNYLALRNPKRRGKFKPSSRQFNK